MNNPRAAPASLKLPIAWVVFASVCGLLFWGLYRSSLGLLLSNWGDGDYSYAWLIPFVVVYLIWEKRQRLSAEPVEGAWWGIAPLLLGIGLFWLGELGGEYYTLYVSSWSMLAGILWLHLGKKKMRVLAFPLFLMLTTFPLPTFLYYKISFHLQLISSQIGAALLRIVGIVAHREGNVIDIGATQLQVVQACSGLRYVFPLFVLGLIVAYFFRASIWKRVLLVLSTVPLTIFWNSMRIALTGILWIKWGPRAAEGFLHDFSGLMIFLVSLGVLVGEMWLLGKIGKAGKEKRYSHRPLPMEKGRGEGSISRQAHLPRAATLLVLLGANLICFQAIDLRQKIPIREPLSKFPLDIAEWRGSRQHFDPRDLRSLTMSDYTLIDYRNNTGQDIKFYVAYFETQFKGGSIHSPETCLPGNGWVFKESATLTIPVKYGSDYLVVNRVVVEQLGKKMLGYFWFPQRGRNLTNIYQLKLYNFWDALSQQRTDGALVRVLTQMSGTESTDEACSRLNEFLSKAVPILDPFIPGRALQNRTVASF
ncbi:MAG TPA: VPLPA-CTERM-specific exosortase XrtD [Syntrophobacteraceae bacterium]|nr:VPLPA-CTERM-specific exosortase XrtD [Syntrophobacteraceae bacterium]